MTPSRCRCIGLVSSRRDGAVAFASPTIGDALAKRCLVAPALLGRQVCAAVVVTTAAFPLGLGSLARLPIVPRRRLFARRRWLGLSSFTAPVVAARTRRALAREHFVAARVDDAATVPADLRTRRSAHRRGFLRPRSGLRRHRQRLRLGRSSPARNQRQSQQQTPAHLHDHRRQHGPSSFSHTPRCPCAVAPPSWRRLGIRPTLDPWFSGLARVSSLPCSA